MEFINRFTPLNFSNLINQGLVAYYPMNERSGPVAFDMSKNNFHGDLINNPDHAQSGRFGDVLDFDPASTQYMDAGTAMGNALGNGISALSVSLWFKAGLTTGADGIFYLGDLQGTQGEFALIMNVNTILFRLSNVGFSESTVFTDLVDWHHLFAQYTGSKGQIYIDNVKKIDISHSTNLNLSGLNTIISNYFDVSNRTFDGKIDQVRIYNRELTVPEIKTLFMRRS